MVQKEHLFFNMYLPFSTSLLRLCKGLICLVTTLTCLFSCVSKQQHPTNFVNLYADTSGIPKDTISAERVQLQPSGLYYLNGHPFSGYVQWRSATGQLQKLVSLYKGEKHGKYRTFYDNGIPYEIRHFKNNKSSGRHYGYWPNGNMQFDYTYADDKQEGEFMRWYSDGKRYMFLHYINDKEQGLQQAWRRNGKLFINYEARDGHKYGLQETDLCYELKNGKLKS